MKLEKATQARLHARSYFWRGLAAWWITDLQGNKVNKDTVFNELYVEPKDSKEDFTASHQVQLDLVASRMHPDYLFLSRKDNDPSYVDSSVNQEAIEHETASKYIQKKANAFIRSSPVGDMFMGTPVLRSALEQAMLSTYVNHADWEREITRQK